MGSLKLGQALPRNDRRVSTVRPSAARACPIGAARRARRTTGLQRSPHAPRPGRSHAPSGLSLDENAQPRRTRTPAFAKRRFRASHISLRAVPRRRKAGASGISRPIFDRFNSRMAQLPIQQQNANIRAAVCVLGSQEHCCVFEKDRADTLLSARLARCHGAKPVLAGS